MSRLRAPGQGSFTVQVPSAQASLELASGAPCPGGLLKRAFFLSRCFHLPSCIYTYIYIYIHMYVFCIHTHIYIYIFDDISFPRFTSHRPTNPYIIAPKVLPLARGGILGGFRVKGGVGRRNRDIAKPHCCTLPSRMASILAREGEDLNIRSPI